MEALISELNKTFNELLQILEETSDSVLNQAPDNGGWSIGEIAEHIIICSNGIPDTKTVNTDRQMDEKISVFKSIFLNMDQKYTADDSISPRSTRHDKAGLISQIQENNSKLERIINEKKLRELCLDMEFPQMGYLTRYEWLYFIAYHTQRHMMQIRNTLLSMEKKD